MKSCSISGKGGEQLSQFLYIQIAKRQGDDLESQDSCLSRPEDAL